MGGIALGSTHQGFASELDTRVGRPVKGLRLAHRDRGVLTEYCLLLRQEECLDSSFRFFASRRGLDRQSHLTAFRPREVICPSR